MKEGRKEGLSANVLLFLGVLIWGAYWIGSFFITYVTLPATIRNTVYVIGIIGAFCYYIGFWRFVRKKGRHPAWFLLSFTWLIGLVVIYLLPKHDIQSELSTPLRAPRSTTR
ncbi:Unannotated [Lentimonas sp. CC4]|nr:Unannotated [Lentimonas sp. CC4]CAA6686036.1 Unannotated [Lentimonas sp. CC6]CAA7075875.1 Unannotated [Lentimonas sp. CC4]CAA7168699.1 Unannotated [Lentimonas sp. CC21]CAA7181090.1 Unannotated [Lentimonas sp. CC8]